MSEPFVLVTLVLEVNMEYHDAYERTLIVAAKLS